MKPFRYLALSSGLFAVFFVSGWLFNDFPIPYNLVLWLVHGACLGANGYVSWLYIKSKSKQNYNA